MLIIPVIDLLHGQVVHAVRGQRELYQPIKSQLCNGSNPVAVVKAFMGIHSFRNFYIADLDLISGTGNNESCIKELKTEFSDTNFWLDAGKDNLEITNASKHDNIIPVIGSETGISPQVLIGIIKINPRVILSLDFREKKFIGDQELLAQTETWPDNIIIMNLSLVGSSLGPDADLIGHIRHLSQRRNIYVGGGIRNPDDLLLLESMNVSGVLIATALHDRSLSSEQIAPFLT